eukprot:gnl/TRDRNA2_/TRDRNA2_67131_c0_seq1.p2 gnl/TRDRNA2_/TRDRNA2_67131_c0~~gnl/TRDRNA2_/TRDRNA2_67131_c0_seq1.p2  ORF type:complete len:176 (+),score=40.54 gnl/TRDRNA2_/TRDRNA2_67131_c0_seq1:126-653(+)
MGNTPCCLTANTVSSTKSYEEYHESRYSDEDGVSAAGAGRSNAAASKEQKKVTIQEQAEEFVPVDPSSDGLRRREKRDQTGAPPRLQAPAVRFEEEPVKIDEEEELPKRKRSESRKGTGYVRQEQLPPEDEGSSAKGAHVGFKESDVNVTRGSMRKGTGFVTADQVKTIEEDEGG